MKAYGFCGKLAAALAVVAALAAGAFAQGPWDVGKTKGIVFATLKNGTLTVSGKGEMANYNPAYNNNCGWVLYVPIIDFVCLALEDDVIGVPSYYFYRESITSVVIEDGVTSIGENAFGYARGQHTYNYITSVTIGNSVTKIGGNAFKYCSNLTSVTISNSVTTIENNAFGDCPKLSSVTIPNSVTTIGDGAFAATGLTSVTIPNSVTVIGNAAFYRCASLESVTLGSGVKTIGDAAFKRCYKLKSITLPASVTKIDGHAFEDCTEMTSVVSMAVAPPVVGPAAFNNNLAVKSGCLYVPPATVPTYSAVNEWKNFSCIQAAYYVDFNSQGGGAVSPQYVRSAYNVIKPSNPSRANYTFSGWYREAACTNPWDFDRGAVTSDITLYAKWTPVSYDITYDLDGGTASGNPGNYNTDIVVIL